MTVLTRDGHAAAVQLTPLFGRDHCPHCGQRVDLTFWQDGRRYALRLDACCFGSWRDGRAACATEAMLTLGQLLAELQRPRVGLEVTETGADPILIGHIRDGAPVLRARPLPPRPGEPDLRICAGCGGTMAGEDRRAKYCGECRGTVQDTLTTRRRRAGKRLLPARVRRDVEKFVEFVNDEGRRKHADKPSRFVPLDAKRIVDALELTDSTGRPVFGPHRVRAMLAAITEAMDGDSVEADDAAHRDNRVTFALTEEQTEERTAAMADPGAADWLDDLQELHANLAAGRGRLGHVHNRPPVRWPGLADASGSLARWEHDRSDGALVRVPPYPLAPVTRRYIMTPIKRNAR